MVYNTVMLEEEKPDLYICLLLTRMVTAREGDVRRELQAVVRVMQGLRQYTAEEVLILIQGALALAQQHSLEVLVSLCKERLNDKQIKEAIGLLAYLARMDGEVSAAEEDIFAQLCLGLGVTAPAGHVVISR